MALLCAEFVRRYPGGAGGRIINLHMGQGVMPMPEELAYATTKGAGSIHLIPGRGRSRHGHHGQCGRSGGTDTGWMSDRLKADLESRMAIGPVECQKMLPA